MTFDVLYVIATLCNLIVFINKWNYFNLFNPFVSLYIGYFLFVSLGGIYDELYPDIYEIDNIVKIYVLIGQYVLLLVGLFSSKLLAIFNSKSSPDLFKNNPLTTMKFIFHYDVDVSMLAIYFLGIFMLLIVYALAGAVPMLSTNVHELRISVLQGRGILFHVGYFFIALSLVYLSFKFSTEKKFPNWYILLCIFAFIVVIGFGSRAHALRMLFFPTLVFAWIKIKNLNKIKIVVIPSLFMLLLLNGVLQYARNYGIANLFNSDINSLFLYSFGDIFYRFYIQLQNIEWIFHSLKPGSLEKLTYFYDLSMLLPGPDISSSIVMKKAMRLTFLGGGITPTIIGESFTNFGKIGTFIMMGLITFLMILYYNIILNNIVYKSGKYQTVFISAAIIVNFNLYGVSTSPLFGVIVNSVFPVFFSAVIIVIFCEVFVVSLRK